MDTIAFTKVAAPNGWLGNMSPHRVRYGNKDWRTTEALFQALRFADEGVQEAIRDQKSPMTAKMIAKKNKAKLAIQPGSAQDVENMRLVLRLKIEQHPDLRAALLATGNARIIEDCSKRRPSVWGAQLQNGTWVGENILGQLWMELRDQLREHSSDSPRDSERVASRTTGGTP